MARRVSVVLVALVAATLLGSWSPVTTFGAEPTSPPELVTEPGHLLGKVPAATPDLATPNLATPNLATPNLAAPAAAAPAAIPSGFQEQILFAGLTHPTVVQFAPDGRVFIAEKSGLIKVFDNLADTTPTTFADLRTQVDDYWDRGLLGLALPPNFPTNPYVYVLYTYDAPIGGTAPVWNDACPTPPGPTTDGCVVSARLSRLQAAGNVMTGTEQVLINDWCEQYPSHSVGTVLFGPDGALYVGAGDGASFNGADYGQGGGGSGSPTPRNPCGDPPAGIGGVEAPPSAEGGALRSQDIRTLGTTGGAGYAATVLADNPVSYWRLNETSGSQAADQRGVNPGTYSAGVIRNQAGATADGDRAVDLNGTSGYISVPDSASVKLADGPFSLEAWINRPTLGATFPGDQEQVFDKTDGGYQVNIQNNVIHFAQAAGPDIAVASVTMGTGWHHIVVTKNGAAVKIYQDGVDVTGTVTNRTLTDGSGPLVLGVRRGTSTAFYDGFLDEVAIYRSVLSASQVTAHRTAGLSGGGGGSSDPTTLDGAILRLDPTTGAAMAGNPMIGSTDVNARRIIAHGVRNPFRFTFRPGTNELWIGDVGFSLWEEIDLLANPTGGILNYGWPCYEGVGHEGSYDNLNVNLCESLYAAGAGAVAAPYLTYNHNSKVVAGETCPTANGSSISGLAFYQGGSYPATYNGGLFFADYSRSCIWFMPAGANGRPNTAQVATFIAPAANPVNLMIGPGGDLFYPDYDGGSVHRVIYFNGNQPPTAVPAANPTSGPAPLAVAFDGRGSTDPENGTLTYAWDFDGNGSDDATTAQTNHTYPTAGTFLARLRVTDPLGSADSKTVSISVGNTPPVPTIGSPVSTLTWSVGDPIAFNGSASDTQDGNLAPARLSWAIVQHHCPTDPNSCHTHTVQTIAGVASGSFSAPDHEYPSWIELVLTATDSGGLQASTSVRLDPKTWVLSFASSPSGLQLTIGTFTGTTPFTRTVIRTSRNSLSVASPQTMGGTQYGWQSWSDAGALAHDVIATANTSYTATFQVVVGGAGYAATVLADNPVSYWRLNETSGSQAADQRGVNPGTYSAGVIRNQAGATADGDRAVDLNGTSGYISVPDSASVKLADGPFSLEAWINRPTLGATFPGDQEQVFDKTDGGYQVNIQNNVIHFAQAAGPDIAVASVTMGTGWHHIVVTKNGAAVKIYQDGVDVTGTVTNRTLTDGSGPLVLGVRRGTSSAFLDGFLDEVAIYRSVLSPSQVTAHRNAGLTGG